MRFFGAFLYQLLGAKDRKDFAYQCDRLYRPDFYATLRPDELKSVHLNPKWLKLLDDGIELRESCILKLIAVKPELQRVLTNPLWELLEWDVYDHAAAIRYLDSLKIRSRALASTTYRDRMNARMSWAMGIPDWERLAFPLALLDAPKYPAQRRWLNGRFCNFLALATLDPAYRACYQDLWILIDQWLSARQGRREVTSPLKWPVDITAFNKSCDVLKKGREFLVENGWLPPGDAFFPAHAAMLWCICLGGETLMDKIMKSMLKGVKRCPDWLRRIMRGLDRHLDIKGF
ncbi:hypothetical protein [Pseudomonas putida]|uniref:hypothetical protein n=1 Tax=Pseudomonas putida TaxID=303 RepID=UPI000CD47DB8|nr:hypothetical protein [Pseudomonas putida]POF97168.1 hypothetical protein BGP81_10690 [Pseudomonas putida]